MFVYAWTAGVGDTNTEHLFLLKTGYKTVYDKDGAVDYYTFDAIVDGEKTTVKSASSDTTQYNNTTNTDGLVIGANGANTTLYTVTYTDGKLTANSMTPVDATGTNSDNAIVAKTGAVKIAAPENGVIKITDDSAGTPVVYSYSYTTDCKVFVIDNDGGFSAENIMGVEDYDDSISYAKIVAVTQALKEGAGASNTQKNTITELYLVKN